MNENLNQVTFDLKNCTSCGAKLTFDPFACNLYCSHCDSRYYVKNLDFRNKTPFNSQNVQPEQINVVPKDIKCSGCGAVLSISSYNLSTICPFCGTTKITTETGNEHSPQAIVPFSVKRESLPAIFAKWIKKRKFVPNSLKHLAVMNNANPVYCPVWLFDSTTISKYYGTIYHNVDVIEQDSEGRSVSKTEKVYTDVSGTRADNFDDIMINAGDRMNFKTFNKISPFNISNIKVYSPEFLAGFFASDYTLDMAGGWKTAMSGMEPQIRKRILREYDADGYTRMHISSSYQNTAYAYALVPVWLCTYTYNNKVYNFFINGTSGKTTGKIPRSVFKISLTVVASLIGILLLILAIINASD